MLAHKSVEQCPKAFIARTVFDAGKCDIGRDAEMHVRMRIRALGVWGGGEGDGGVAFGLGDEQAGYNVMAGDDLQDVVLPPLAVHSTAQYIIPTKGAPNVAHIT